MFKLWLFWAFLRIQLLGLLRTMTTFTSGQASRPDLAPLALLPGQLKNCLGIYPGSDDSAPAPQTLSLPTTEMSDASPVCSADAPTPGSEAGMGSLLQGEALCKETAFSFSCMFCSGAKGTVPHCMRFPRRLLGPACSQKFLQKTRRRGVQKEQKKQVQKQQHRVLQPVWGFGFFVVVVCFLAWGKSYKFMDKHSQCLELDWIGIFDSYLGPRWIIWGGTEQKDRAEGGKGVWERLGRRPTAICSRGSAAQEQQLQAGAKRSERWPLRSRLSGEESFGARGRGSQLDGKGELEGAMFPLARRPSSSCAWHGLLQGSAEPQGPVATSPRTNSACPCTLVAQQRAEVNALITGTEFSKESELLLNGSRQSFGWRRPGSRTLPALAN